MNLKRFSYFSVLAEELHFGRAAERIGIAQPALSQQIRRLETEVGTELIRRDRREVRLSPAGEAFLPHAERALAEADGAAEAARAAARGEVGHLHVGFIETAAGTVIPRAVQRFRVERPGVGLSLHEMGVAPQIDALRAGRLDLAVVRPPVDSAELMLEEIAVEELLAAIPSQHHLASLERLTPHVLSREPLIALARDVVPGLYDQILLLMQEAGESGRMTQEATSIQAVLGLVAAGLGIAILPDSVRSLNRDGVQFTPIESSQRSTMIGVYRQDDDSPLIHAFLDAAKER